MSERVRWAPVVALAMALAYLLSGLVQARSDGFTVDEGPEIAAGVTALVHRELQVNPEHALLGQITSAAPALFARPPVPQTAAYEEGRWFDYTDEFLRAQERAGTLGEVRFLARLVPLAQGTLVGLLLFRVGRRWVGDVGGLIASGLWFTTPFTLGFAHVVSTDIAFTTATVATVLALERHLRLGTDGSAAVVGLALGAALLTRFTAIGLAAGVAATILVVDRLDARRAVRQVLVVLLLGWLLVWVGYRALDPSGPSRQMTAQYEGITGAAAGRSVVGRLAMSIPWPLEYRGGLGFFIVTSEPGPTYVMGQASVGARPWSLPASLLVRAPLLALPLVAAGVAAGRRRTELHRSLAAIAIPGLFVLGFLSAQPFSRGVRLALPIFALLCLLAAPAAVLWRRGAGKVALGVAAVVQLAAFASAHPHSLTWTTPPFTPGYRWTSDVDYGQDLDRVTSWSERRHAHVALFLPRGLPLPPGDELLVGAAPSTVRGWVAVGAAELTVFHRDELAWLRAYCPVGQLGGGSVLLYFFDDPPSAEPGPTMPARPCSGPTSRRR